MSVVYGGAIRSTIPKRGRRLEGVPSQPRIGPITYQLPKLTYSDRRIASEIETMKVWNCRKGDTKRTKDPEYAQIFHFLGPCNNTEGTEQTIGLIFDRLEESTLLKVMPSKRLSGPPCCNSQNACFGCIKRNGSAGPQKFGWVNFHAPFQVVPSIWSDSESRDSVLN
jgi:hypothetical protein